MYFRNFNILKLALLKLALTTGLVAAAEDLGKTSYLQMCSGCHGPEGKGLQIEGAEGFPPLSQSEWLRGDADRVAQIILHGLQGSVTVKGITYNQVMPAQGSLSDEQVVAVINYVRSEFADEKGRFSADDLKQARKFSSKRESEWTAKELLKHYPLPKPESPIKNLLMKFYTGDWNTMPDFTTMDEDAVEEEHDGYISLKKINTKNKYGLMWEGEFEVTKAGKHVFELDSDDGSRLWINGKVLAEVKGVGPMGRVSKGSVELKPGMHTFRLDYFQKTRSLGITLRYKQPDAGWQWLSDQQRKASKKKKEPVVIDLTPKDGRVRMYNNFIAGSSPRTMGVGYPLGNNIAFSTSDCNLDLIWKGNFISAGRHWTARGKGDEPPASKEVVKLSRGVAWSDAGNKELLSVQLKGIQQDKIGSPTFGYTVGDSMKVADSFVSSAGSLARSLEIDSNKQQKVSFKIADSGIQQGSSVIIDTLQIQLPKSAVITTKGKAHYVTLNLKKGSNQLSITYSWKK